MCHGSVNAPSNNVLPVVGDWDGDGKDTVGLYDSPDATETDHSFPLPVMKASPFAPPPKQPSARM